VKPFLNELIVLWKPARAKVLSYSAFQYPEFSTSFACCEEALESDPFRIGQYVLAHAAIPLLLTL
jgi:hypothetical protein